MKHRYEKNIRVMTDLLGYCHYIGATEFSTGLVLRQASSVIEVRCKKKRMPRHQLEELHKYLNIPRQREVEQYYWNVGGEENLDSGLSLVGMMVDTASITFEDGELCIICERLHEVNE